MHLTVFPVRFEQKSIRNIELHHLKDDSETSEPITRTHPILELNLVLFLFVGNRSRHAYRMELG